eukprot:5148175-Prymnesium_polylepis.1
MMPEASCRVIRRVWRISSLRRPRAQLPALRALPSPVVHSRGLCTVDWLHTTHRSGLTAHRSAAQAHSYRVWSRSLLSGTAARCTRGSKGPVKTCWGGAGGSACLRGEAACGERCDLCTL